MSIDPASRWDDPDPLGAWLGTCANCGLPMWQTQLTRIGVDGRRVHVNCQRPGMPGVVSPITTTTKGTTMERDFAHDEKFLHDPNCDALHADDEPCGTNNLPIDAAAGAPDTAWFCDTAKGIIGGGGQRRQDYGSVEESFEKIARMWSVILDMNVTAEQVALCQATLKMGRLLNKPNHTDSWVDIIGYAALGGQIAHQPGRHT